MVKLRFAADNVYHNNALFIKGNVILTNEHFFFPRSPTTSKYIPNGTLISILDPFVPDRMYHEFVFNAAAIQPIISVNNKDLILYQLPVIIPPRPTIIHHFWSGNESLTHKESLFMQLTYPTIDIIVHHTEISDDLLTTEYNVSPYGKVEVTQQHDTFAYNYRSSKGDCGSPIIVKLHDAYRIVGFHAAGISALDGKAFGIIVTKEQLLKTVALYEQTEPIIQRDTTYPYEKTFPVLTTAQDGTEVYSKNEEESLWSEPCITQALFDQSQ